MESIHRKVIAVVLFLLVAWACKPPGTSKPNQSPSFTDSLCNGDLIVRMGKGFSSKYFSTMSAVDKRFSHVGIIFRNNDTISVIHAMANSFGGNGHVRITSLQEFVGNSKAGAIYRFPFNSGVRKAFATKALQYAKAKVPFDWKFNNQDTASVYCTELVLHVVNSTLGRSYIKPLTQRKHLLFVSVEDTYTYPEALKPVIRF